MPDFILCFVFHYDVEHIMMFRFLEHLSGVVAVIFLLVLDICVTSVTSQGSDSGNEWLDVILLLCGICNNM